MFKKYLKILKLPLLIVSSIILLSFIFGALNGASSFLLEMFWYILLAALLIFIISSIATILMIKSLGFKKQKISIISILVVLICSIYYSIDYYEIFESETILKAERYDDPDTIYLFLNENGSFKNKIIDAWFRIERTYEGHYYIQDSLLIAQSEFNNTKFDDTLLLDINDSIIFIRKQMDGTFDKRKSGHDYKIISYNKKKLNNL